MVRATSLDQERGAEIRMLRRMHRDLGTLRNRYPDIAHEVDSKVWFHANEVEARLKAFIAYMESLDPRAIRIGTDDPE